MGIQKYLFSSIVFLFFFSASRICVDQIYCHYLICLVMSYLSLHLRNHLAQWGCEISKSELLSCIFKLQNKLKCINGQRSHKWTEIAVTWRVSSHVWDIWVPFKRSGNSGAWKMIKMTLLSFTSCKFYFHTIHLIKENAILFVYNSTFDSFTQHLKIYNSECN